MVGLTARCSDHKPLLISMTVENCQKMKRCALLKYEANWATMEGCEQLIEQVWSKEVNTVNPLMEVQESLKICIGNLIKWSKGWLKTVQKKLATNLIS